MRELREAGHDPAPARARGRRRTRCARASASSACRTPASLVLFGATGDLAHRKVVPALYQLWRTNLLPARLRPAVHRPPRRYDDETFRDEFRASLEKYSRVLPLDEAAVARVRLADPLRALDFADAAAFDHLAEHLEEIDAEHGTGGNRLFYLATQPSAFAEIVGQLGRVGLDHEQPRRRLAPDHHREAVRPRPRVGERLNREVGKVFRESQVYRIDHYLGKETVQNLLVFRFGNGIFEPIWNRRYVDHVQITVAESIGVEGRGAFYEETGAVRDFLQNHLLQLLSLVAMEPPATFEADAAARREGQGAAGGQRDGRRAGARRTSSAASTARAGSTARRSPGYREETEVDPESETETFVAARLEIDDWRWAGVPFYLRTGKRLPKRATEIAIQFKEVPHRLFRDAAVDPEPNLLAMRIQPDEGIMLRFAAKVPGLGIDVRSVTHGLHLRLGVHGRLARRLRDADPRRDARRRVAVHPGRRGRGGLVDRRRRSSTRGHPTPPPDSRTTRPARGARQRPTSCWLAMAAAGGGSDDGRRRWRPAGRRSPPESRRARSSRWRRAPRTIEGIEKELARIWTQPPRAHDVDHDGVVDGASAPERAS